MKLIWQELFFSCLSCRALRWQQSCHRGMEVRSSMLFGKQVHTMSGLEFLLREKVRTDMYWYIDMYWCFVNFSSVNSWNSPWTMQLSSELCWSSPRGLPLAAPAYTAAIRTLGRRLCWHEALGREAPLPSFSFLFSFLLFHTISGCFCTLHSTMQDVHFGSFLICTFCIPCILPYIDWRSWLKS